jgi:hypothetical protein
MSEQQTEGTPTPPEGEQAPPSVEPLAPPEPAVTDVQPVGQTQQATEGRPLTDEEQGVGIAPTEPGDAGEGNPGTAFQTTEQIEAAAQAQDDETAGAV